MSLKLAEHAPQDGTYHVDATFEDETKTGIAPTAIAWTLCDRDGAVVNGRSAVAVAVPATTVTITAAGTDLSLIAGKSHERLMIVRWTYDSTYGSGLESSEQGTFIIDPRKA